MYSKNTRNDVWRKLSRKYNRWQEKLLIVTNFILFSFFFLFFFCFFFLFRRFSPRNSHGKHIFHVSFQAATVPKIHWKHAAVSHIFGRAQYTPPIKIIRSEMVRGRGRDVTKWSGVKLSCALTKCVPLSSKMSRIINRSINIHGAKAFGILPNIRFIFFFFVVSFRRSFHFALANIAVFLYWKREKKMGNIYKNVRTYKHFWLVENDSTSFFFLFFFCGYSRSAELAINPLVTQQFTQITLVTGNPISYPVSCWVRNNPWALESWIEESKLIYRYGKQPHKIENTVTMRKIKPVSILFYFNFIQIL